MSAGMPEIGLRLCGKPDGWVPGDDDDPRLEAVIEHRADEMLGNADDWCELFERAAASEECRRAAVRFMTANHTVDSRDARAAANALKCALAEIGNAAAREDLSYE